MFRGLALMTSDIISMKCKAFEGMQGGKLLKDESRERWRTVSLALTRIWCHIRVERKHGGRGIQGSNVSRAFLGAAFRACFSSLPLMWEDQGKDGRWRLTAEMIVFGESRGNCQR